MMLLATTLGRCLATGVIRLVKGTTVVCRNCKSEPSQHRAMIIRNHQSLCKLQAALRAAQLLKALQVPKTFESKL